MYPMKNNFYILLLFYLSSIICLAASPPPVSAKHAMVVTSNPIATKVGLNILKQGGNAIDAAVAIGYTLAVTEPCCGNLGGGGFMTIHLANGRNTFLNFRERAPLDMNPKKIYFDEQGRPMHHKIRIGYYAVGVPGTVMGLNTALKKYGTMQLTALIQPAINLAKNGFKLTQGDVNLLKYGNNYFKQQTNIAKIFLNHGKPYQKGEILKQENLAKTLTLIKQQGTKAFYDGKIANEIVQASQDHKGVLTKQDFQTYTVQWLKPIECKYRSYTIISAPPPSSGGVTLCEMLQILNAYPLEFLGFNSSLSVHYISEAMRFAYADRNQYLGDPDFVVNPIDRLLSKQHIKSIRKQIPLMQAGDSSKIGMQLNKTGEKMQTTSYSVVDKYGNAVAVTYTINGYYGAKVIAGNTGFFLNNELDDFAMQPGVPNLFQLIHGKANQIEAGKRPLSSMTPTLVLKDKKIFMVLGAAGGSTIPTQILAAILNVIDYHMNIQEAIDAPRFHMQWMPDVIFYEPFAFSKDTMKILELMGYKLRLGSPFNTRVWGRTEAILINQKTGLKYGAADSRFSQGIAMGY